MPNPTEPTPDLGPDYEMRLTTGELVNVPVLTYQAVALEVLDNVAGQLEEAAMPHAAKIVRASRARHLGHATRADNARGEG